MEETARGFFHLTLALALSKAVARVCVCTLCVHAHSNLLLDECLCPRDIELVQTANPLPSSVKVRSRSRILLG